MTALLDGAPVISTKDKRKPQAWALRGRGYAYDQVNERFLRRLAEFRVRADCAFLSKALDPGLVMDLGCGTGRVALPLSRDERFQVVGIDAAYAMLAQFAHKAGNEHAPATCVNAVSTALPLRPGSLAGVYSYGVVLHYQNWTEFLRPVVDALRPGGVLAFDQSVLDGGDAWSVAGRSASGIWLGELERDLDAIGLTTQTVVPLQIGASMAAAAHWFPASAVRSEDLSQVFRLLNIYIDRLLRDDECMAFATALEGALQPILVNRGTFYAYVVARKAEGVPAAPRPREPLPANVVAERIAAALADLCARHRVNDCVLRYLATLDPYLRHVCDGADPVTSVVGAPYTRARSEVGDFVYRLIRSPRRRAMAFHFHMTLRRMYRRALMYRVRLFGVPR